MILRKLLGKLEEAKIPYLLVGGYALAFHGIVRATVDIDLVISLKENHLIGAEKILNSLGLQSRLPVRAKDIAQFHEEYRKNRNLTAWSFVNYSNPAEQVDLLIHPPLKSLKGQKLSLHGESVFVATKQTLLKMKKMFNRPEDQRDIALLEEALNEE